MKCIFALLAALTMSASAEPRWVAVGEKGFAGFSKDGIRWEVVRKADAATRDFAGVAYGDEKFLAWKARFEQTQPSIFLGMDGRRWEPAVGSRFTPDQVIFAEGKFVAIRGTQLRASPDGRFGEPVAYGSKEESEFCSQLAAGDTEAGFRYVALGHSVATDSDWRAVSSDGKDWDRIERIASLGLLAYGAGHFVIVSADGTVETSHDGETWRPGSQLSVGARRLLWIGDRFLASAGEAWSSADGFEWQKEAVPWPGRPVWADAKLGAFCERDDGAVLFSRDLKEWRMTELAGGLRVRAIALGR